MSSFQVNFYAPSLRRATGFTALLPNYDTADGMENPPKPPFRTLYLLPGYLCNDWDLITLLHLRETVAACGPVAVIVPNCENTFFVDSDERDEYYGRYIAEDLVQFTREVFPLSARREDTFIGGFSMGGYGAMLNGMRYGDVFGKIIGFSSAMMIHDFAKQTPQTPALFKHSYLTSIFGELSGIEQSDNNPEVIVEKRLAAGLSIPSVYMCCGEEDFLALQNEAYYEFLKTAGVNVTFERGCGGHEPNYWNSKLAPAFKWMLQ